MLFTSRNVFSGEFVLDQTPEFLEPYFDILIKQAERERAMLDEMRDKRKR